MRKLILYMIFIAIFLCTYISISYAFYISKNIKRYELSTTAIIPGCLTADLVRKNDSSKIALFGDSAAPVSDTKALSSDDYRYTFIIKNNCKDDMNVSIALAPSKESTMPISLIKYALEYDGNIPIKGTFLSSNTNTKTLPKQIIDEVKYNIGSEVELAYEMINMDLSSGSSKEFNLYVWIDENENGIDNLAMNKTLFAHLLVSNFNNIDLIRDRELIYENEHISCRDVHCAISELYNRF